MSKIKLYAACLVLMTALPLIAKAGPNPADESFFIHLHDQRAMANVTISAVHAGAVEIAIQLETVEEMPLKAESLSVNSQQSGQRHRAGHDAGAADRGRPVDREDGRIRRRALEPRPWHYDRPGQHRQHRGACSDLLNSPRVSTDETPSRSDGVLPFR
jgi:hypothetical protein